MAPSLRPDPLTLGEEWRELVEAEYEQVERLREWQQADYYSPVAHHFIEDPRRTGDALLAALLAFSRPTASWLDIGAGGGRFALPLALHARQVFAVEPSPSMRENLERGMTEYSISNVDIKNWRWPDDYDGSFQADFSLAAHVTYDIRQINPFLDTMEAATRERCFMLQMDTAPSSNMVSLWQEIHGEPRVVLPSLREMLHLLLARGALPEIRHFPRSQDAMNGDQIRAYARRRLWLAEGSPKDQRLQAILDERLATGDFSSESATTIALIAWEPARA